MDSVLPSFIIIAVKYADAGLASTLSGSKTGSQKIARVVSAKVMFTITASGDPYDKLPVSWHFTVNMLIISAENRNIGLFFILRAKISWSQLSALVRIFTAKHNGEEGKNGGGNWTSEQICEQGRQMAQASTTGGCKEYERYLSL